MLSHQITEPMIMMPVINEADENEKVTAEQICEEGDGTAAIMDDHDGTGGQWEQH
jgi:hypothetical protein